MDIAVLEQKGDSLVKLVPTRKGLYNFTVSLERLEYVYIRL